jgi:diguanylate cyclase (GGDEF)-like protein
LAVSRAENNEVRVILVGRTGLDAVLRLDPGIELVRVQQPLEAVGELASPVDALSPTRSVVVLSPEVEWALRQPTNGSAREGIEDFLRGLRIADPGVVVMGVSRNGASDSPRTTPLDGTIATDLSSEMLRRAIRQQPVEEETQQIEDEQLEHEEPPDEPVAPAPPIPAPAARSSQTAQRAAVSAADSLESDVGDLSLASLLVKGQELMTRAMELIRVRTGDDAVEFIPFNASATAPVLPTDQPVAWEGTVLGHLRSKLVEESVLAVHAHWLAAWLRARDQQSQLRAAAFTDPLTGAYNRRYFDRFLATAIDQARDARRHLTVFVFDIDDFKTYNDRYGHDAGDEILRETVRLMRSVIRPTDRVCRIGGDEFAVIFNEPSGPREEGTSHPKDMFTLAQRFQQQVRQHRFPKLSDCLPGTLTVSGGLATFPWDGGTPEQLLSRADQNALASKRQGKNAITFGPNV